VRSSNFNVHIVSPQISDGIALNVCCKFCMQQVTAKKCVTEVRIYLGRCRCPASAWNDVVCLTGCFCCRVAVCLQLVSQTYDAVRMVAALMS
jgi:hypothetical protein